MSEFPETFETDPRSKQFLFEASYEFLQERYAAQVEENFQKLFTNFQDENMPDSSEAPALWRSYKDDDQHLFEIGVCRAMDPRSGDYVDGALVRDFKEGSAEGPHSITVYTLVAGTGSQPWSIYKIDNVVWADCFRAGDWLPVMNSYRPGPVDWKVAPA